VFRFCVLIEGSETWRGRRSMTLRRPRSLLVVTQLERATTCPTTEKRLSHCGQVAPPKA
jgi:hypothetical protein